MPARETARYVGRFAPSPTGPLHFGSLVAAVASYLEARSHAGRWLLRIEDIDPPRETPGAADLILDALQRYGFEWDGDVLLQSTHREAHLEALQALQNKQLAYRCRCSRKKLQNGPRGPLGVIYPGTCRRGCEAGEAAIRVITDDTETAFDDALQGRVAQHLLSDSGDFVVYRRDGLIAYHLAVVVDDEIQGVTDIVRGIDLMDSTPRQLWLQKCLDYRTQRYSHIPVVVHANGDKLSKLTGAPGIPRNNVEQTLVDALRLLQQRPPQHLARESLPDIWQWAIQNWQVGQLQGTTAVCEESGE